MNLDSSYHDVVVVGARVAGASAALHLARQGFDVLIVERANELGPVLSSHQMNIVASECLREWGLYDDLLRSDCPGIREIVFDVGDIAVTTKVPALGGIDQLHYCKRKVLDNILVRHAALSGARVSFGTGFLGIASMDAHGVEVEVQDCHGATRRLRTRFLIGADGRASSVAKAIGAQPYNVMVERAIMCFGYFEGVITHRLEIYMCNDRSAALFPTNEGETCLVVAYQIQQNPTEALEKEAFFEAAISAIPSLRDRLGGATPKRVYRYKGMEGYHRQPHVGRCALVGDAGYFRDPIVGEGIADAMLSAELLATQVAKVLRGASVEKSLILFKQIRDEHFRGAYERTRKLLRFDYDYERLNEQIGKSASGPTVLKKILDGLLSMNRRTRRDLFDSLAAAELEI